MLYFHSRGHIGTATGSLPVCSIYSFAALHESGEEKVEEIFK